ncbi:MAG: DNRLRE domain-containing protein [Blastocatellia bacterium]
MRRTILALLSVLIYLPVMAVTHFSAPAPDEQTKVLQASKDNTLIEVPENASINDELSNGKGPVLFVGRTGQSNDNLRRALIAFDIAGAIPARAKITSVRLKLKLTLSASGPEPARVTLHRVKSDWGEGESKSQGGRGAQAAEGDATWLHPFYKISGKKWTSPGGVFVPKASASQLVSGQGIYTWDSTPALVADVQTWLDSPKTNFGWLLRGDEAKDKPTAKVFQGRDGEDEAGRPQLIVTFVLPASQKK